MADWLVHLLQIGGLGAVLLLALFAGGKWLLKRITAALDSYATAYLQQEAEIDARIANLEKLAKEQERLTRTVESIKDEIAAEAKRRDNRWEFRKTVYVNLLTSITDVISALAQLHDLQAEFPIKSANPELQKTLEDHRANFRSASASFIRYAALAPLAIADSVLPITMALDKQLPASFLSNPEGATSMLGVIASFNNARDALQDAGREDLWGTLEAGSGQAGADGPT
jgi:multidrug efflux pump subunit AcrA (membrane-fusion protein)